MRYANWIVGVGLTFSAAAFGQQVPSLSNRVPEDVTPIGEVVAGVGCPCLDGLPEAEPDCGLPTDTVNGGCNSAPNVFTPISPGDTYCGTADWNFTTPMVRDTDWYQYTVTRTQELRWQVEAEFPALLAVVDGNMGCLAITTLGFDFTTGCGDVGTIEVTLNPGTYWFFVAPDFSGPTLACGAQYTASLLGAIESVPAVSSAGLVGIAIAFTVAGASMLYLRRRSYCTGKAAYFRRFDVEENGTLVALRRALATTREALLP